VKTRLAPSLSPKAVTAFYCCLLDDTLALARSLGDVEVAIMCPDSDVNELARLASNEASVVTQKGEVLAAGLTSVFAHFAEATPAAFCSRRRVRNAGRFVVCEFAIVFVLLDVLCRKQ
jgi:2-phospho-L-lactate guanylyltransferase (CobY/MobA/RfbA family)